MSKIKTHKAAVKRFSITGSGKIKRRKAGQDHYNSRESGNTVRKKRRDIASDQTRSKTIKQLIQVK